MYVTVGTQKATRLYQRKQASIADALNATCLAPAATQPTYFRTTRSIHLPSSTTSLLHQFIYEAPNGQHIRPGLVNHIRNYRQPAPQQPASQRAEGVAAGKRRVDNNRPVTGDLPPRKTKKQINEERFEKGAKRAYIHSIPMDTGQFGALDNDVEAPSAKKPSSNKKRLAEASLLQHPPLARKAAPTSLVLLHPRSPKAKRPSSKEI